VKTILERIPIVDIRKPGEDGLGRTEPAIVTVLVEASEADRLALADAAGKIRFALRNPGDTAAVAPEVEKPTRTGLAVAAPSVQGLMVELTLVETANESDTPGISVGETPAGPVVARWTASASGGSIAWIDRVYQDTHVRLSLRPTRMSNGRIEALVEPEISWPGANASGEHATEARRLSRPMAWNENQRLVVSGLSKPGGKPAVLVIAARRMPER
jgi:hypothetical protein